LPFLKLRGSLPVIPTPFFENKIDYASLERLFDHLFPELEGYTLCGSTGEAVSLSLEERIELMRFAAQRTPPGKVIVAGLTHTNLAEMQKLAQAAVELGIHAGLVPCPYYFPNEFSMVLEFFRELDHASPLPLVLYDNPLYTKTWLRTEEIFRLLDACPNLKGVKMTDHDLRKLERLKRETSTSLFSGDDVVAFRSLMLGVDGSMIIAPSIFPAAYQETIRLLKADAAEAGLRVFSAQILPFIHLFGPGDEVSVTKAVFHSIGIFRSPDVRLPLLPCSPARLRETMLAYGICQPAAGVRAGG
jgi:4-hydroxy-tetrahydrodipicolinate synthase